jgi:PAS domain S-box-containing protein
MLYTLPNDLHQALSKVAEETNQPLEMFLWQVARQTAIAEARRYQALLNSQLDLICCYTPDTVLTFVNDAYCRYFGKAREDLIWNRFLDFVTEDQRAKVEATLAELRTDPRPIVNEYYYPAPDGKIHWIQWVDHAVFDEAGQLVEVQAVGRDITALRAAEIELRRLLTEREYHTAEMERFLYAVSHDLKSPLITVRGFIGMLEHDVTVGDAAKIATDLSYIREAAEAMQAMLDGLLEVSRVGRVVNTPTLVPLSRSAQEAVNLLRSLIRVRGVTVTIAPDLPTVFGDAIRLREVFQNLIENAIKFMGGQTSPLIEIGVRTLPDGQVATFVKDNGIGIDPRHQQRVFGLFEQLNPTVVGTGIGLALVKRIIEFHGGKIWVESEGEGRGSVFLFTLPTEWVQKYAKYADQPNTHPTSTGGG